MAKKNTLEAIDSDSKAARPRFYSYLLTFKKRRVFLAATIVAATTVCAFIMANSVHYGGDWRDYGLLVAAVSTAMILVPITEEWQYHSWQTRPHRHEKIMFD